VLRRCLDVKELRKIIRVFARAGEIWRLGCWPGHSDGHQADTATVTHNAGECQLHSPVTLRPANEASGTWAAAAAGPAERPAGRLAPRFPAAFLNHAGVRLGKPLEFRCGLRYQSKSPNGERASDSPSIRRPSAARARCTPIGYTLIIVGQKRRITPRLTHNQAGLRFQALFCTRTGEMSVAPRALVGP